MTRFHPVCQRRRNHAGAIKCAVCGHLSPIPRRCPLGGAYMCSKHGQIIRRRIRRCVEKDPSLSKHMHAFGPYFLHYVNPRVFGIAYGSTVEVYRPAASMPRHPRRARGGGVIHCSQCNEVITEHTRRGVDPHSVYCNACGLAVRRELKRRADLDARFQTYFHANRDCAPYLRPEVQRWVDEKV